MDKLLEGKILPYKTGDEYDLKLSYSGLELFEQCPYRYMTKYIKNLRTDQQTIALEVGSICHKVLEIKADMILEDPNKIDFSYLKEVLDNGYVGSNVSDEANVLGVKDIINKYGRDSWVEKEQGASSYEEKLQLFWDRVIQDEVPYGEDGWMTLESESPFNFIYMVEVPGQGTKKVLFNGFIDRIDIGMKNKEQSVPNYRVVDYKTSKKVYDQRKLSTPLQMIIYGMALAVRTDVLPVEYQYSFILLDEKADACTRGYLKRGINKIDKLLTDLFERMEENKWETKGSPLCYWCEYNRQSIVQDKKLMNECERFCLWTPNNKTFECVDPWNIGEKFKTEKSGDNYSSMVKSTGTVINGRVFGW